MAEKIPMFPIPDLQGDENFEEWRDAAYLNLKAFFLEGFVNGTETLPQGDDNCWTTMENRERFAARRKCTFWVIYRSIIPILPQLKSRHWTMDANNFDPKVLWDAIHLWDADRGLGYKCGLMEELAKICHCQFGADLKAYCERGYWLRTRLSRMEMPVTNEMYMGFLVKGLRTYDLNWVHSLYMEIERGSLDPDQLEIKIGARYAIDEEERERRENRLRNEQRELAVQLKNQQKNNKRRRNARPKHSGHHSGVAKTCSTHH